MRWLSVAVLAFFFVLVSARTASAHAGLVASSPSEGALLEVAPKELVLKFSEPVEVATAAVNVETAAQQLVQTTRPLRWKDDPTALVVPITKKLVGSLVVFWRVVGDDSHVVSGGFSFVVLPASGAAANTAVVVVPHRSATLPGVQGALSTMRAVTYGAMSALVGGVLLLLVVWPAGADVRRMRRLLWGALGSVSLATLASANLAYAAATGRDLGTALKPTLWLDSTATHYGWIAAVRLVLLVLAGVLLADLDSGVKQRSVWWIAPAALVAAGLVRTPGLVDHGASASPIESAAYFLHMAGITVWVGGLIVIVAVLLPERQSIEDARAVLTRFSAVATFALGAVVASGVVLASPLIEQWRDVPTSAYGQLFLTKLVLVAAVIGLASRVRHWVRTGAFRAVDGRALITEVGLALVAIAVTAVLVGRSPDLSPARSQLSPTTKKGSALVSPTF